MCAWIFCEKVVIQCDLTAVNSKAETLVSTKTVKQKASDKSGKTFTHDHLTGLFLCPRH